MALLRGPRTAPAVAEGVEEPAQLARLKAQACDQARGYLLYRPMRAEDAGALLRRAEPVGQE